jgi:hypothetical protein
MPPRPPYSTCLNYSTVRVSRIGPDNSAATLSPYFLGASLDASHLRESTLRRDRYTLSPRSSVTRPSGSSGPSLPS